MGSLLALVLTTAWAAPGREIGVGDYKAVLFSAQDYAEGSGVPDLETPTNDIDRIGHVLETQYGFDVERHPNATRREMVATLTALAEQVDDDDVVLIYYAGHGEFDEDQGVGYWLPADAVAGDQSTWLGNPTVQAAVRALPARHVLMVIDACFSGEFARERGILLLVEDDSFPGAKLARRLGSESSRLYLSSGGNEAVSDEGPPGRVDEDRPPVSVFAYFFEKLLTQAEQRYVLPSDLVPPLRQRVFENASQTPRFGVVAQTGHGGGEVVLINRRAEPCVEGAADCLGDDPSAARPPPATWTYDVTRAAFDDPDQVRLDRRAAGAGLLAAGVAAGVGSVLLALRADERVDTWSAERLACGQRPVVPDCDTLLRRASTQQSINQQVGGAVGLGITSGALVIASGFTFTVHRRARRARGR
ncbi:MAG: caspase family protein [Myxococcota bacterium]